MRKYKCRICKQIIENEADIAVEKYKQQNRYSHIRCKESKEKEWNEWCNLYDYILSEYFVKQLPPKLIVDLKKFRELYTFKEMYGALISSERKIKALPINDLSHQANLIMYVLKSDIEDYILSQKTEKDEMLDNTFEDYVFITKEKKKVVEEIDYDIFD